MVRAWVETNHANGVPFTLMTPFPRKVFTEDDMGTPLKVLSEFCSKRPDFMMKLGNFRKKKWTIFSYFANFSCSQLPEIYFYSIFVLLQQKDSI